MSPDAMDNYSSRFLGPLPGGAFLLDLARRICFSILFFSDGTNTPAEVSHIADTYRVSPDEDDELVSACQKGDVDAFGLLVRKYQKRMLNMAYRIIGDYEDACETVQETFLSAYKSIGKFRKEAAFSTWIYGICVNHARNRLKQARGRSRHEVLSVDDPEDGGEGFLSSYADPGHSSALEGMERKELQEKVQQCIGGLEEEYREVLVLRDIQGFSYDEIRDILKVADGTVKSRLFRARTALKDSLKRVLGDL
jgi:RNA polymerase sigma-70 factor, ECF subfamily